MRQTCCLLAVCIVCHALACAQVTADQLWISGSPVPDAKLTAADDKSLTYTVDGKAFTKPLKEVTRIEIQGQAGFNDAERLLSEKKYRDAQIKYLLIEHKLTDSLHRNLLQGRLKMLRDLVSSTASKRPAKCSSCNSTGKSVCPDCKGKGTAPCSECKNGYVKCRQCGGKGKWRCDTCGGDGKHSYGKCYSCDGKGMRFCSTCGTSKFLGYKRCGFCQGTGADGDCYTCGGTRRVDCDRCQPPAAEEEKEEVVPPPVRPRPVPANDANAFLKELQSRPQRPESLSSWSDLTTLQQERAVAQHEKDVLEWQKKHDYHGLKVDWQLPMADVTRGNEEGELNVILQLSKGLVVRFTAVRTLEEHLLKLSKGDTVRVQGKVAQYAMKSQSILRRGGFPSPQIMTVTLEDVKLAEIRTENEEEPIDNSPLAAPAAASHVVFLLDRSGSMAVNGVFDRMKRDVTSRLKLMRPTQRFNLLLFSDGRPVEFSKAMLPASKENVGKARSFLDNVYAKGQSDPLPTLRRAFGMLGSEQLKGSKSIVLITDGAFKDNQKVIDLLKILNRDRRVHLHLGCIGTEGQRELQRLAGAVGAEYFTWSEE